MFRKQLIPFLLDRAASLSEIAKAMRVAPGEAADDLRHLMRSLKRTDYQIRVTAGQCRKCGFTFGADKLGKPSRCPRCRSTWLREPRIGLEKKNRPE